MIVPAGEFTMGSPPSEMYRGAEAQNRVTITSFALGKHEVTFAQWELALPMAAVADSSRMTKGGVVEISPLSELTQLLVGKVMMNVRTCDSLPFPKHQPNEMRPNLDIAH